MKNILFFLIGFAVMVSMAYASKWESSSLDAMPIVGYGIYDTGSTNTLVPIKVDVDGTVYLH